MRNVGWVIIPYKLYPEPIDVDWFNAPSEWNAYTYAVSSNASPTFVYITKELLEKCSTSKKGE